MPFFKRKQQERSGRLEELEAHVKKIRKIAAEDPNGAGALQSFLIEDGYWERQEVVLQTQEPGPEKTAQEAKRPPEARKPPATPPEAGVVTAGSFDSSAQNEDEALLEAELQRYLARIAEETEPDGNASYDFESGR